MDYNFLRTQYELPKSPAPTLYENDSNNNDDDDVQFMGTITPSGVGPQINLGAQLPLLLATPPLSPPEIQGVPGANMPTVTSFLSSNYNQPSSYLMIIPCYLCKRPFTDVEQLRQHLNIHAQELMGTVAANVMVPPAAVGGNLWPKTTTTAPVFMEPVGATPVTLPPPGTSSTNNNSEQEWLSCFKCNEMFTQRAELHAHHSHCRSMQNIKKNNNNSKVNNNKTKDASQIKPFKCHLCQRRYMRDGARQRHVRLKHSWAASMFTPAAPPMRPAAPPMRPATPPMPPVTPPMPPVTPPRALTPPTPPTSCEDVKPQIRKIYTTKQLNALAAANYNPAKESAAKYLPPTVGGSQLRKYPLRSPYFNPNLLNPDADYV